MMVGLAETTHRDRHEGEVPEAAPAKHPLPPSPPTRSETNPAARSPPFNGLLSPSRQRLFHLLQRQILLQLAADARGADVDPRRRPPHAATPHGILARWLTADPTRLRGSCLLVGLHSLLLEGETPTTHPSQRGECATSSGGSPPAFRSSSAALQQHEGTVLKEEPLQGCREAAAAAAVAADTPQKEQALVSSPEGASGVGRGSGENAAAEGAQEEAASSGQEGKAFSASTTGRLAVGLEAARGSCADLCVICCSALDSKRRGFLCTPCLLRLGSSSTSRASSSAEGEVDSPLNAALPEAPKDKAAAKEEQQLSRSLHSETHLVASQRMAKRRCFKRAAAAAQQAQQQQQQQPPQQEQQPLQQEAQEGAAASTAAALDGGGDGPQEDASWRARATAAAAATEEASSWWCVPESSGESAVIPPLLLPLLPSIFSLHARPWPPPPAKRRRIVSRRRRGLCMGPSLTEGPSWEDVVRSDREGALLLHLAPPEGKEATASGQQRDDAAAAAAAVCAPAEAAEGAIAAARGNDIAPAAATGAAAREGDGGNRLAAAAAGAAAAATGAPLPGREGKQASDSSKEEKGMCCCIPSSSTSCLGPSFECPATGLEKGKKARGPPCPACCLMASTDPKTKGGNCLCCPGSSSPLSCPHEALLPRRRRARLSDPAGTNAAAAVVGSAAAAGSGAAAGRDIAAAAAAAAANFKTDGQQHEQHTPPSRFRRRSCGADVSRQSAAADAAAAEAAAVEAAAAEAPSSAAATTEAAKCESTASLSCGSTESSEGGLSSPPAQVISQQGSARAAAGAAAATNAAAGASAAAAGGGAAEEMERASKIEGECPATSKSAASALQVASASSLPPSSDSAVGIGAASSSPASSRQGGAPGGGGLARISQGLMVGPSSLGRGSGLGIYSCRSFSRRAVVCEYSGVLIDRGTALLLRRMRCASHVINVQMQHLYLLGFHTPSPLLGGGAFVNDGRWRSGGREGPGVSVRFRVTFDRNRATQRVMVVAARDIEKGEELLTSYDNDYWRLMAQQGPPYAPPSTHRGR